MPVVSRFQRYFLAVAQYGSIRRASDALGISASSIDRQILLGEQDLGTPLFERLPAGLRLTASGELLLARLRIWVHELDTLRVQIDDLKGVRRGHVKVLIPEAMVRGMVPRVIGHLRDTVPGITVSIAVLDNHDIGAKLIEGAGDLAFIFDPDMLRRVTVVADAAFPLGFVSLPGHPLTQHAEARFSACTDYPVIAPDAPLALERKVDTLCTDTGVQIAPVCRSNDIGMMKSLVMNAVGIAILGLIDVLPEVEQGVLAFIPIANRKVRPLTLGLCIDPARSLSAASRLVVEAMKESFPRLPHSASVS